MSKRGRKQRTCTVVVAMDWVGPYGLLAGPILLRNEDGRKQRPTSAAPGAAGAGAVFGGQGRRVRVRAFLASSPALHAYSVLRTRARVLEFVYGGVTVKTL